MQLELESTLICHSCKKQESEKMPFNLGNNAEGMAKIVEKGLLRRHVEANPECISSPEFTITSKIVDVNTEGGKTSRPVISGLDVEGILNDLDSGSNFTEGFFGEPVSCAGHVGDF